MFRQAVATVATVAALLGATSAMTVRTPEGTHPPAGACQLEFGHGPGQPDRWSDICQ
jgi:hypothetical protein